MQIRGPSALNIYGLLLLQNEKRQLWVRRIEWLWKLSFVSDQMIPSWTTVTDVLLHEVLWSTTSTLSWYVHAAAVCCCVFSGSSWTGRTGFVQGALKEDGIRLPRNSALLVCGHPAMGEEAKAIALAAGVLDGRVLSNYWRMPPQKTFLRTSMSSGFMFSGCRRGEFWFCFHKIIRLCGHAVIGVEVWGCCCRRHGRVLDGRLCSNFW